MNKSRLSHLYVIQALSGSSRWREIFNLALLALGYYLAVRFGLLLVAQPEKVASIWPASGVAVAALLISRRQSWLKALSVIFLVNVFGNVLGGNPLEVSLGFALANTLETLLCAWVLMKVFKSGMTFESAVEAAALFGVAIFCNGITAILGAAISTLKFNAPFASTWLIWWASDGLGIILVTPVIVTWHSTRKTMLLFYKRNLFELLLFALVLVVFALLLFGPFTSAEKPVLRNYMVFPLLIWLAFRFSVRDTANMLLVFSALAVWSTLQGHGIFGFANQPQTQNLIALQIYLSIAVFSGLFLSAMVGERRQAEHILQIAEAKYHSVIEDAPVGIFQSTPQGRYLSVNPAMAKMYGYGSPQEMLASIEDISRQIYIDPAEWERFKSMVQANRGVLEFVGHHRRKDGKDIWAQTIARIEKDNQGQLRYYEGFVTDVTERKQMEETLRTNEEKYRMVANFTYDWETWHAPYGTYLYVSPACERITGYTAEEFINMPNLVVQITHPEDRQLMIEHFRSVSDRAAQKDAQFDFRIITKSGETRWINHSCIAVYDADGKWLGRRESNRDITQRKKSEAVLRSRLGIGRFADIHTVDEVLEYMLNEVEALTESHIAFFHTLDADQKTLTLQMWSTNTLQNMCTAEGKNSHYSIDQAGIWMDCVRKRTPVIYNDYFSVPNRKGLPPGHAPVARILTVPVFYNDLIVAIIGVGNKPADYDFQDIKTIRDLADLAWDVIQRKRSEDEVRRTKTALELANHELQSALAREQELSHTDSLTGINNRRYLFELTKSAFDLVSRHRHPLSAMMVDVDHFKKFNDTYGHDIGDLVLQQVVNVIRTELRSADVIGRYGGEEFVIILPMTTAPQAHAVAERIRSSVEALRVPTQAGDVSVTISVGIVELDHALDPPESVDVLIRHADEAMYASKNAGRNRITIYRKQH